jgi:hypothetical protein
MIPLGVCLSPEDADRGAIVRVTTREGGRSESSTYYLCYACADGGGDLRITPTRGPGP